MKHRIPRSPFATRLSGSARETEIRIRNIFQGPKKRPPVPMMLLTALVILSCGWLVSCQPRESDDVSSSGLSSESDASPLPPDSRQSPPGTETSGQPELSDRDQLILDYYQQAHPRSRIYLSGDEPDTPQWNDVRIDSISYAGESSVSEMVGVAYEIGLTEWYQHQNELVPSSSTTLLILSRGVDGSFQQVLGEPNFNTDGMAVEDIIRQAAWHLLDLDVCLWRDGWPIPVGPGNWQDLFNYADEGEPTIETLEGWEPIYWPGDYWDRWSREGITALRYYIAAEDRWSANTIDVTRSDLYTPRGIRVGSTRAEVLEAYPDLYDTPYWHDTDPEFPEGDYLWYCDNEEGWGTAILFFFEGDTVRQVRLTNMFD